MAKRNKQMAKKVSKSAANENQNKVINQSASEKEYTDFDHELDFCIAVIIGNDEISEMLGQYVSTMRNEEEVYNFMRVVALGVTIGTPGREAYKKDHPEDDFFHIASHYADRVTKILGLDKYSPKADVNS